MTIVHSEAPWGQPEEERLAPKERTHPMRPLSRNNNTTTRLKRGPNPLSGVLILVLNFFVVVVYFLFLFLFVFVFCFLYFIFFFLYLFLCLFVFIIIIIFYFFVFIFIFFFFIYALICCTPGDNHNRSSSPQATERS